MTGVRIVEHLAPPVSNCLRCGKPASLILSIEDFGKGICLVMTTCPGHYLRTMDTAEQIARMVAWPAGLPAVDVYPANPAPPRVRTVAEIEADFVRVAEDIYARHPDLRPAPDAA